MGRHRTGLACVGGGAAKQERSKPSTTGSTDGYGGGLGACVPVGESFVDESKEEGDIVERGVGGPPATCHAAAEGHCLDGLPCQELVCYPPQGAATAIVGDAAPQLLTREQRLPGQRQAPLQGIGGGEAVGSRSRCCRCCCWRLFYVISLPSLDWCGRSTGQLPDERRTHRRGRGGAGPGCSGAGWRVGARRCCCWRNSSVDPECCACNALQSISPFCTRAGAAVSRAARPRRTQRTHTRCLRVTKALRDERPAAAGPCHPAWGSVIGAAWPAGPNSEA